MTWCTIRVELVEGGPVDIERAPGRVFLVGPDHTFGDFATAIDTAFARWDAAHLHEFTLADGRRVGVPDEGDEDEELVDEEACTVTSLTGPDAAFAYVFDFGDNWQHRCRVERTGVDPEEEWGEEPLFPVPIMGWGWIPDQYGRVSPDEEE